MSHISLFRAIQSIGYQQQLTIFTLHPCTAYLPLPLPFRSANPSSVGMHLDLAWSRVGGLASGTAGTPRRDCSRVCSPSLDTDKISDNKEVKRWVENYLGVGEWVMDQSVAVLGSTGWFERRR